MNARDREAQARVDEIGAEIQETINERIRTGSYVCDFCSRPSSLETGVTFVTDGPTESTTELIDEDLGVGSLGFVYDPAWLACQDCAVYVRAGDPEALAAYAVRYQDVRDAALAVVVDGLTDIYRMLYRQGLRERE